MSAATRRSLTSEGCSGSGSAASDASQHGGRVLVALSGGVDSAVAAALLVKQGYEVVGAMLRQWTEHGPCGPPASTCPAPEAVVRARRVADRLDIPFYLIDAEAPFKTHVVDLSLIHI